MTENTVFGFFFFFEKPELGHQTGTAANPLCHARRGSDQMEDTVETRQELQRGPGSLSILSSH